MWTRSPSAAHADAWSTALMLLDPEEIATAEPEPASLLTALHLETPGGFLTREFPLPSPAPPPSSPPAN